MVLPVSWCCRVVRRVPSLCTVLRVAMVRLFPVCCLIRRVFPVVWLRTLCRLRMCPLVWVMTYMIVLVRTVLLIPLSTLMIVLRASVRVLLLCPRRLRVRCLRLRLSPSVLFRSRRIRVLSRLRLIRCIRMLSLLFIMLLVWLRCLLIRFVLMAPVMVTRRRVVLIRLIRVCLSVFMVPVLRLSVARRLVFIRRVWVRMISIIMSCKRFACLLCGIMMLCTLRRILLLRLFCCVWFPSPVRLVILCRRILLIRILPCLIPVVMAALWRCRVRVRTSSRLPSFSRPAWCPRIASRLCPFVFRSVVPLTLLWACLCPLLCLTPLGREVSRNEGVP